MSTLSLTVSADMVGEQALRDYLQGIFDEPTDDGIELRVQFHDEPHPAYRNVQSGRYVSAEEAAAHPDVTVHET